MTYVDFDGKPHQGRLIVHAGWARPVLGVFRKLYEARFPIRRMRLQEAYGSNDDRLGFADDTSGFNCRYVKGTHTWSEHAYGRAIDLNPRENPQVAERKISPPAGRRLLDRTRLRPGMIHPADKVVRSFAAIGWRWGGYWRSPVDYMHFSATGR
jgi:D-alanyl-D-alanine carboxypeptidase-like protein